MLACPSGAVNPGQREERGKEDKDRCDVQGDPASHLALRTPLGGLHDLPISSGPAGKQEGSVHLHRPTRLSLSVGEVSPVKISSVHVQVSSAGPAVATETNSVAQDAAS